MTRQRPNREQRRHPTGEPNLNIPTPPAEVPSEIQALWTKSNFTRVSHCDGAFGGVTPSGNIYIAFYSEHAKTPTTTRYEVDAPARQIKQVAPQPGQIAEWEREIEAEVIMNLNVAKSLRGWLDDKIKALEQLRETDTFTERPSGDKS